MDMGYERRHNGKKGVRVMIDIWTRLRFCYQFVLIHKLRRERGVDTEKKETMQILIILVELRREG
jgi:hypothetical protein